MNENSEPLISRQMVLFGIAAVAIMFGIAAWAWGRIPDEIPIHWDMQGEPDGWGGKFEGLMLLPLITAGLAPLFLLLPLIPSQRANLERSRKAYQMFFYTLMLFMIGFQAIIVQLMISGGEIDNMMQFLMIGMGLLFMVIGNYSTTIRRNHIFGFRTRWTLSSDYAWRKTHRVGGWLFMGMGSLYVLYALLRPDDQMMILHVVWSLILMTLFTMVYSYWMWRSDPDRTVS